MIKLHTSTFSIVACDVKEQTWGVIVASYFPAVGAIVPWVQASAGAVATQSFANTSFGPHGLEMMAAGLSAEETLAKLLADDPKRELRQVGLVDAKGKSATFTGKECLPWAGGVTGVGYAIQGNLLAGANVVKTMEDIFHKTNGNLVDKLYNALLSGDRAGGDRRGRQSAAIYVAKPKGDYHGFLDRWIDLRVDDHIDPVLRLGELIEMYRLHFEKSPASDRVIPAGDTLAQLQTIISERGYYHGHIHSKLDKATREALISFIVDENFNERTDSNANWIDRPVLNYILKTYRKK